MSRISIVVTEHQHRGLKALAALKGVSLKDEKETFAELESFLDERLRKARAGKISKRKAGKIFKPACREAKDRATREL